MRRMLAELLKIVEKIFRFLLLNALAPVETGQNYWSAAAERPVLMGRNCVTLIENAAFGVEF